MVQRGFLFKTCPCYLPFIKFRTNPSKIIIFLLLKYNVHIIENVGHIGKNLKVENKDLSSFYYPEVTDYLRVFLSIM